MGPLLLARLLDLNDVQEGVLNIAFKRRRRARGLLLLDLKDLRAMLSFVGEHAAELTTQYGNVSKRRPSAPSSASCWCSKPGRRQVLRRAGARSKDFMKTDATAAGVVNILAADKLMQSPRLYATFLLWLLSELFESCPRSAIRQAEARVLLRRGASAVQRRAEGAARQDRAGGAADPLEGRRRLFRHAEPDRRARQGAGPARQPRAARAARLHAARPEGGSATSGPWGHSRVPQTEPTAEAPRPRPRAEPRPAPRTTARRTDSIGTTIAKTATRTVTNVFVREATKAVMKNGESILRGIFGSLRK
jgi:hypothetical protein